MSPQCPCSLFSEAAGTVLHNDLLPALEDCLPCPANDRLWEVREVPHLPQGPLPSICPALPTSGFRDKLWPWFRKQCPSKKVGALVQLGQSAQSPFCVILGSCPVSLPGVQRGLGWSLIFMFPGGECGWGVWELAGDLCPPPRGPGQGDTLPRACLPITHSRPWGGKVSLLRAGRGGG